MGNLAKLVAAYWLALGVAIVVGWPLWGFIDWRLYTVLSGVQPDRFSERVDVVDVSDYNYDPQSGYSQLRLTLANFITALATADLRPQAVGLDFTFLQGQASRSSTVALRDAIVNASHHAGIDIYAANNPPIDKGDNGISDYERTLEQDIYGALTNSGHTAMYVYTAAAGLAYQECLPLQGPVWNTFRSLVSELAKDDAASCNWRVVRLAQAPTTYEISAEHPYSSELESHLTPDTIILIGTRRDTNTIFPTEEHNTILLGWALSNQLSGDAGQDFQPMNPGLALILLVLLFSAGAVVAFVAVSYVLRRVRLRRSRIFMTQIAAVAAALGTILAFAVLEFVLTASHIAQPQVSLVVCSICLAAGLSEVRGRQIIAAAVDAQAPPEKYDYDVFISYAREEFEWVRQHVYDPLRCVKLSDGSAIDIYIDRDPENVGGDWHRKIALAINGSTLIVPFYSATYFSKDYCLYEIDRAHVKWIYNRDVKCVLPIMRGNPKIPPEVNDIAAVSDEPSAIAGVLAIIADRINDSIRNGTRYQGVIKNAQHD